MPSLPISTAFTDSAVTEAGFKTAITNQREFLAGLLGTTGNQIDALVAMGVLANDTLARTSAYTVVAADRGKSISCSGTFTLSLTAAATLGDGFSFIVVNTGSGTITIDPNSTEKIDGVATKTLAQNQSAIICCDGTNFYTIGISAAGGFSNMQVFTSSGTFTVPAGITKVKVTVVGGGGNGAVGQFTYGQGSIGGGGGGGGAAIEVISGLTAGGTVSITVGGAGGTSSFGTFCSATGGSNGTSASPAATAFSSGGSGGLGSGGNLNIRGDVGQTGCFSSSSGVGGAGGGPILGGGGRGGGSFENGTNGGAYGGGGGGCPNSYTAGTGAAGVVIVEY